MTILYLVTLVVLIGCMALLDRRFVLAFWQAPLRAAAVVIAAIAFYIAWDLVAIAQEIYYQGGSGAMTGISLAPELPLEELFFIIFLSYLTLVMHGLIGIGFSLIAATRRQR